VLKDANARGRRYLDITTAVENVASKRVIDANGGIFIEEFVTPPALGGRSELRYRVPLDDRMINPRKLERRLIRLCVVCSDAKTMADEW
jgi:hypothetical protein